MEHVSWGPRIAHLLARMADLISGLSATCAELELVGGDDPNSEARHAAREAANRCAEAAALVAKAIASHLTERSVVCWGGGGG